MKEDLDTTQNYVLSYANTNQKLKIIFDTFKDIKDKLSIKQIESYIEERLTEKTTWISN